MPEVELVRDGAVAAITLRRAAKRNALSLGMMRDLATIVEELDADDAVVACTLAGDGTAFAAGADVHEYLGMALRDFQRHRRLCSAVCRSIELSETVYVAAVEGVALGGGCELAMACDLAVAGAGARFGLPEIQLGLHPGWGGAVRLARLVPRAVANDILLTGRTVEGAEAAAIGLVSRVVEEGEALGDARALADVIVRGPRSSVRHLVGLTATAPEMSMDAALQLEGRSLEVLFGGDDAVEGVRAFVEKRAPRFGASTGEAAGP